MAVGAVAFLKVLPDSIHGNPARRGGATGRRDAPLVWIVDDEPVLGELYELVLQSAGYITRIFPDRLKALSFLGQANNQPALLITDFINGPMGLDAFLQRFRSQHPQVKVLMVTGCDQRCLHNCGARPDGLLFKPFEFRHLLSAVRMLTGAATI